MTPHMASIWAFPTFCCSVISMCFFSFKFGRPLTGLIIGFIVGQLLSFLTMLMYDFADKDDIRIDSGMNYDEMNPAFAATHRFFRIWFRGLMPILGCLFVVVGTIAAIGFAIWLTFFLIGKGF